MGVGEVLGAVAGAVDALLPVAKFGYSIYEDQRDTSYQHNLQDKIFSREDNAIQRRMADLESAGLNPNLAAGQGANAGQVVGRSPAQSVNTSGSILDTFLAIKQLQKVAQETENAKSEGDILNWQTGMLKMQYASMMYGQLRDMGYEVSYNPWIGKFQIPESIYDTYIPFNSSPTNIDWARERSILGDTAYLRGVDANWANVQKGVNIGSQIIGDAIGLGTGSIYITKGLQGLTGLKKSPIGFKTGF